MVEFEIYTFNSLSGKTFTPEVQKKIDYVFSRVLHLYPDKKVTNFNKNYRKFAEGTVVTTRRAAGYPDDNVEFFADFGFEYIRAGGTKSGISSFDAANLLKIIKADRKIQQYYDAMMYPEIFVSKISIYDEEFLEYLQSLSLPFETSKFIDYIVDASKASLKKYSSRKLKIAYNIRKANVKNCDKLIVYPNNTEVKEHYDLVEKMIRNVEVYNLSYIDESSVLIETKKMNKTK